MEREKDHYRKRERSLQKERKITTETEKDHYRNRKRSLQKEIKIT